MKCLSCKVGELKLTDYMVKFNRSKGKLICNKCGHKEVF
jgi:transcription elongation factor Elf1